MFVGKNTYRPAYADPCNTSVQNQEVISWCPETRGDILMSRTKRRYPDVQNQERESFVNCSSQLHMWECSVASRGLWQFQEGPGGLEDSTPFHGDNLRKTMEDWCLMVPRRLGWWQMVETHLCFYQARTLSIVAIGITDEEKKLKKQTMSSIVMA